jgi:hypothetical protein
MIKVKSKKKVSKKPKSKALNKPAVKRSKLPSTEWSGSSLPGHGSVFRRFFPNM